MKVYKFQLKPNKEQENKFIETLDICRFTYNKLLEELNKQEKIDRNKVQHKIVELKKEFPKLKNVYSKTLQYECYRLFSNLKALSQLKKKGNKVGKLRFKGKDWFKTFVLNQSGFKLIKTNKHYDKLGLSKIGNINIRQHQDIEGNIKGIIIKKKTDNWEAHIITDSFVKLKKGNNSIGIDLGIISFLTDNTGNKIKNPLYLKQSLSKLKIKQQNLSRKKKGSNNREKAKKEISKLYEMITNQRMDFLHKITTKLIQKNKFIAVENLNIKQMQTSVYNVRNISDSSWAKFLQLLDYKAESAGCQVVKVNPMNTTKMCSNCGNIQDMPLYKRQYECENCEISIDRDKNSAINILNRALEQGTVEMNNSSLMKQEAITLV